MDDYLRQLRRAPPSGLFDGLDDRVFSALALRRKETTMAQRFMVLSAFISLGGGAIAGIASAEPVGRGPSLSPFAPVSALASSALLDSR